jgi:hypothetical protein
MFVKDLLKVLKGFLLVLMWWNEFGFVGRLRTLFALALRDCFAPLFQKRSPHA